MDPRLAFEYLRRKDDLSAINSAMCRKHTAHKVDPCDRFDVGTECARLDAAFIRDYGIDWPHAPESWEGYQHLMAAKAAREVAAAAAAVVIEPPIVDHEGAAELLQERMMDAVTGR